MNLLSIRLKLFQLFYWSYGYFLLFMISSKEHEFVVGKPIYEIALIVLFECHPCDSFTSFFHNT
jgi:hypothetical protein